MPELRAAAIWSTCVLSLCACSAQAGHDYHGEPLLSMRGHATVSALTADESVVPALCFFSDILHKPTSIDWDGLPADVLTTLKFPVEWLPEGETAPPLLVAPTQDRIGTIVDVESHGEFPAQFDVDVYVPPPDSALRPLFSGEPRSAYGHVCAATSDHAESTHHVQQVGGQRCADANGAGPCTKSLVWVVPGSDRYYAELYVCPEIDSAVADCTKSTQGDETLQYEFWSEQVVGAASQINVVYLADAAPAGSFTAWGLGASEGLAAGYHLFAQPGAEAEPEVSCNVWPQALQELSAKYDGKVDVAMFPLKRVQEDPDDIFLPDNVIDDGMKIVAHLQMEMCPMPAAMPVSADDQDLSIHINQVDPNPNFPAWVTLE